MIDLAVDALATHRLTRLITRDTLTADLRGRVIRRAYLGDGTGRVEAPGVPPAEWASVPLGDDAAPKVAQLVTCPWCVGVWVAFGVVAARRLAPRWWEPIAQALALSSLAGFASLHDHG